MFERPPREAEWVSWAYFLLGSIGILATIPFARSIQNRVAELWGRQAFTLFVIACIIVALAVVAHRLFRSPVRWGPGRGLWLLAVAATYTVWAVRLGQESPEEAVHFLEYGGLSLLAFRALGHRHPDQGIHIGASLLCALVGTTDEILQWLTPGRYWDLADVALNAASGALMQLALWRGFSPPFLRKGIGSRSLHMICRLGAAQLLLLGLCSSNTPARIAWLSRQAPFLRHLETRDSMMVEYGYRYSDPDTGVFFSRFAPSDLRQRDARRGEEAARWLDQYRDEERYREFLQKFSPATDPFLHEARVHLFRRDRFIAKAEASSDLEARRHHCTVAYRENRIMEKYFSTTLRNSSYVLNEDQAAFLSAHLDPAMPYVSAVSDALVVRVREWQVWVVILLSIGGLELLGRRGRRQASIPARRADSSAEA